MKWQIYEAESKGGKKGLLIRHFNSGTDLFLAESGFSYPVVSGSIAVDPAKKRVLLPESIIEEMRSVSVDVVKFCFEHGLAQGMREE